MAGRRQSHSEFRRLGYLSMIWTDWGLGTRTLGSEYLPVRDTSVLIDFWVFGDSWRAHHAVNLFWYLSACLVFHRLLYRWFNDLLLATALVFLFIVHPVHVESVVWLASRKDVLSYFLYGFDMVLGTTSTRRIVRGWVLQHACGWPAGPRIQPLYCRACCSFWHLARTETLGGIEGGAQWIPYAMVLVIVVWMSLRVGEQVGMFREPWADSHIELLCLQLILILHYSWSLIWPLGLSAVYELPIAIWNQPGP